MAVHMRSSSILLLAYILATPLPTLGQNNFLSEWAPAKSLEATFTEGAPTLLADIEEVLGREHRQGTEGRLAPLEDLLRPTFLAMPKNEYGNLGHATVRYTLHRFFVGTYGWSVRGLDIEGGAWNGSSPLELLKGYVPADVQAAFESRLGGRGFGLRELAVLASTVVQLVREETVGKLKILYTARGISINATVNGTQAEQFLTAFMGSHVVKIDLEEKPLPPFEELTNAKKISAIYPSWYKTEEFLHGLRQSAELRNGGSFGFHDMAAVLEEAQMKWSPIALVECAIIKRKLLDIEEGRSGCVRLSDFYYAKLRKGAWQFSESPAYMRQSGLLDESDKETPRVIIANYLNAPGNCLAQMGLYSVRCVNECEGLFGKLESALQAPEATPSQIADLVARLPSASEPANRTLSPLLLHHLDEVAERHNGKVPLHGRLFAQWMHFAYPRECPFPRVAGAATAIEPWDFQERTGQRVIVTRREAYRIVHAGAKQAKHATNNTCALWDRAEELYVHFRSPAVSTAALEEDESVWAAAKTSAMLMAMACVALLLVRSCQSATTTAKAMARRDQQSQPKRAETVAREAFGV